MKRHKDVTLGQETVAIALDTYKGMLISKSTKVRKSKIFRNDHIKMSDKPKNHEHNEETSRKHYKIIAENNSNTTKHTCNSHLKNGRVICQIAKSSRF